MMNTFILGLLIVGGFCIWKFIIQPRMNEDKPIEPDSNNKTFGEQIKEQMEDAVNPNIDI